MSRAFERIDKGIQIKPLDSGPASTSSNPSDNIEGSLWVVQNELRMYLDSAIRAIVTADQTQTLSNKTLDNSNSITIQDTNLTLQDDGDNTKQAQFNLSALSTASTRTYTMPDDDCVLVGDDSTQTLTNKTLVVANNTVTTAASGNLTATELNAALAELQGDIDTINGDFPAGDIVGTTDTQTLTNKTIDGDDNTIQDLALSSLKTEAGDANTVVTRDGSGAAISTKASPTGDFVGTTDTQTLTNKTIDGDDNTVQDLALSSLKTELADADKFIQRDSSGDVVSGKNVPTGDVVGTTDTQALTNKDIDGGTASNTSRITLPKDTKANLDALTRKEGTIVYATDDDKVYYDDGANLLAVGTGEGAGGINYVTNPDAEVDASDWSAYADAAQSTPTDGTGGSPTATLTRTTSSPLRGNGSFLLTKDAANRQGEGASTDLTIDSADQAKVLRISFDYDDTGANYEDGDIRVYIYDVTNAQLIEPTQRDLLANGVKGTYLSEFQANSNSTSYRLILHIATTNASAYTIKFDNVQVGPREIARGPIVEDWQDYTPVVNGVAGSATPTGKYRRVGDGIEVVVSVLKDGTAPSGSTTTTFSLPSGLSIDTNKINSTSSNLQNFGHAQYSDGSTFNVFNIKYNNTTTVIAGIDGLGADLNSGNFAANGQVSMNFKVPIEGFSSNVQTSSDFGGRIIAARYTASGSQTINDGNSDRINYDTKDYDTTNSVTTGAFWTYNTPESGYYRFEGLNIATAGYSSIGNGTSMRIKDTFGATKARLNVDAASTTSSIAYEYDYAATVYLEKGEEVYVDFQNSSGTNITINTVSEANWITITKIQSPQTLAGGEVVAMSYNSDSGQAVTTGNTIVYEDIDFDTHGAYNTSTGEYTVPVSGKYTVHAQIQTGNVTPGAATQQLQIRGVQSGSKSITKRMGGDVAGSTSTREFFVNGSATFDCQKGDVLSAIFTEDLPAVNLVAVAFANNISITKIN
jgi:hypothetical protein